MVQVSRFDPLMALQEVLAGRFSIERELGRGGMGVVYLAHDLSLDREVAIKVLPPLENLSAVRRERFAREARLTASLTHPNILPVHFFELHDDIGFFVMGFVRGETLRQRVQRCGPLDIESALKIIRDVAWALDHAHSRGIIHRDIKPDNIMLDEESGRTLVMDFGIAIDARGAITATGTRLGTPGFASPEQLRGVSSDRPSDIYGLGATTWFALTGDPPPARGEVQRSSIPAIRQWRGDVPNSVAQLLGASLSTAPNERPASAGAFAQSLDEVLSGGISIPGPLRDWLSRGRGFTVPLLIYSALPMTVGNWPKVWIARWNSASFEAVGYWMVMFGVPWLALFSYRTVRLLSITGRGYRVHDIRSALVHWQREMDHALLRDAPPRPALGSVVRFITFSALFTWLGTNAIWDYKPDWITPLSANLTWIGFLVGWIWPGWARPRRDVLAQLRLYFWESRMGGWLVGISSAINGLRRKNNRADAVPLRYTEVAVAEGIGDLLKLLESPIRSRLAGIIRVSTALERHAGELRGRADRLERWEDSIGSVSASAAIPEHASVAADMAAQRDEVREELRSTVVLLERLRVGLLRLVALQESADRRLDEYVEAEEYMALLHLLHESQALVNARQSEGGMVMAAPADA